MPPLLSIGNPEMLTSTIVTSLSSSPSTAHRAHLQHLTLTPNLRYKSAPSTGSANAYSDAGNSNASRCVRTSGVEVCVAKGVYGGEDAGVFLGAAVAVVPHGPEVGAGVGGGGQGEEGYEAEEEDAEAAVEHV